MTKTLFKIFVKGFFKANSGLLLVLFISVGLSFFFIETAGHISSLSAEEQTYYHFILAISFVTSPVMTIVLFVFWFMYAIKSFLYVINQLLISSNQFLYYSITSISRRRQFLNWCAVQLLIFIPIIFYWFFASIFGLVYHNYILPGAILLYILFLTSVIALLYTYISNSVRDGNKESYLIRVCKGLKKPLFSLFIFHVFDKMKLGFIITKLMSLIIITGIISLMRDFNSDLRLGSIIVLSITIIHSYLIYQEQSFTVTKLSFSKNFPYKRVRRFVYLIWTFLFLILPEIVWLLTKYNPITAIELLFFGLSLALLFRSILLLTGLKIYKYLKYIVALYLLIFIIIMYDLLLVLIPITPLIAYIIFYNKYYNQTIESKN